MTVRVVSSIRLQWPLVTAELRALVIDDDVAIRLLVRRILERRHFIVESACDGAEGIEKLAAAVYGVIILDLMMPRIDGAGVLRYLAEHDPARLATVVVMTAFGASEAKQLSPQPAHFLEKPFDVEVFMRVVGKCLQQSGGSLPLPPGESG